jgi:molybdate transport system regulatory protein
MNTSTRRPRTPARRPPSAAAAVSLPLLVEAAAAGAAGETVDALATAAGAAPAAAAAPTSPRLFVRVMLAPQVPLGPGKADLLQAIAETGSIAAAARRLGMSYQRAHDLVAELNGRFTEPLVAAAKGGAGRGGAALTPLGTQVLQTYRALLQAAEQAAAPQLAWLAAHQRR